MSERVIGPWGAVSIVAGSMVGIGIFLTPAQVAQQVESIWMYLAFWLFGGAVAFAGATCYAELGSRFPSAGGDYVFIREALGNSVAFATGMVLFVGIFVGSIATMSVAVSKYQIGTLMGWGPDSSMPTVAGLIIVAVLTVVNMTGARVATGVQFAVTMIPVSMFCIGAFYGLFTFGVDTSPSPIEATSMGGLASAFAAVYFAYAGWNAVAYVGGEVKDPNKNIPIGLVGGTVLVTVVYLLMNVGFIAVLGLDGVRQAFEVGTATAAKLSPEATNIVLVLIVLALLGSINATVLGGARIAQALAEANMLPKVVSDGNSPNRALILQAVLAALFIVTGTFESLLEMTSIAMLLIASLAVIGMIKLRQAGDAEVRAIAYPLTPAFFLLTSLVVTAVSVMDVVAPAEAPKDMVTHYLPIVGLVLFVVAWLGHRLVSGERAGG